MAFSTFCLVRVAQAQDRARAIAYSLQRRRIVRERHATRWRLYLVVERGLADA